MLDGKVINEAGYLVDRVSGEGCRLALPQQNENLLGFQEELHSVIVRRPAEMARRAIEMNVNCLIVCQAELPEGALRELPTHDVYQVGNSRLTR